MTKYTVDNHKSFTIYTFLINSDQVYITASVTDKNADPVTIFSDLYESVINFVIQNKMNIISDRIFGNTRYYSEVVKIRNKILINNDCPADLPFTYIEGQPCFGDGIAGIQVSAISSNNISTIIENDTPVGRKWKSNGATFLMLQNIYDNQPHKEQSDDKEQQACRMFERAQKILKNNSASYHNVVRTWIYLANILHWYPEFNKIRNAKYHEFGFIPDQTGNLENEKIYLPASTGILGTNPFNTSSIMDLLAVIPEDVTNVKIAQTSGTKQRSPFNYGSAFSRAMNIHEPDNTTILLSGTASINRDGNTVFASDTRSQILKTFEIVEALIRAEGASLKDICTATVFIKKPEDFEIYQKTAAELGLSNIPAVSIVADVCRHDLLFEIDATLAFPVS
jgi:enamine deaminase RidA (YjgF/YER057c/UK114 family)